MCILVLYTTVFYAIIILNIHDGYDEFICFVVMIRLVTMNIGLLSLKLLYVLESVTGNLDL